MLKLMPKLFIALIGLFVGALHADSDSWEEALQAAVRASVSPAESLQTAYISSARDRSSQDAYYPFLKIMYGDLNLLIAWQQ